MAGFWKRWLARHVNAVSFWFVLALVALALVLAAYVLPPSGTEPWQPQPHSPSSSPP